MKLQLVNAPSLRIKDEGALGKKMYPPLGLLYLASYVRQSFRDLDVKVTDGLLIGKEKTLKEVSNFDPEIIGVSCTTPTASGAYDLINNMKNANPNALILLGGVHPTAIADEAVRGSKADLIIVGEGELILSEIIKRFTRADFKTNKDFSDVKGLHFEYDGRIYRTGLMPLIDNLDKIPFPARDLINLGSYEGWPISKKKPETSILSSRGCPFRCDFCSNPVWKLQKPWLRLRSPSNVVDEVQELVDKYRIKEYFDQCDEFNHSLEWAIAVCKEKQRRGLDIPWKVCLRADKINDTFARALANSGCWYVHLGIESGNQDTLNGIGKMITLDQVVRGCEILKKYGIKIFGLFMLFNVWDSHGNLKYEDAAMTRNTLKFARRLFNNGLIDYMSWSQTTPYPGSKLWNTAIKYGLMPDKSREWESWNHVYNFTMDLPGISEKDRTRIKFDGAILQAWCLLKSGNVSDKKYVLERGWGHFKRGIKSTLRI